MSARDNYKRFVPVRASPVGDVTYEDPGIPVHIRLRIKGPPMEWTVEGWVIAWTRNAVLVVWIGSWEGEPDQVHSRWIEPNDVRRKDPRPKR